MHARCHTADTCIYGRFVCVCVSVCCDTIPSAVESNKNSPKIKMIIIFIGVFRILRQLHRLPEAHNMEIVRTQNVDEYIVFDAGTQAQPEDRRKDGKYVTVELII